MISVLVDFLGSWIWVAFALALLGIEILMPSSFLLWPGLAALLVGIATLVLGLDNPSWPWQAQVLVFLVASLIIAWFGRDYVKRRKLDDGDKPTLNERGAQLMGQTATLLSAIENGQGRAKIGDTSWVVRGPNIAKGKTVRVTGYDGSVLIVEAA